MNTFAPNPARFWTQAVLSACGVLTVFALLRRLGWK